MIPPGTWAAPALPRPLARIRGASRFGIGQAGDPPRLHLPHGVCYGLGVFLLRSYLGLRWLLRPLTCMPHHAAQLLLGDAPRAIFDLHVSPDAVPMPAAGRFHLRPPRFLHQQRQGGLLLPPRCECLAHSTAAWD
jgi:hypothetical protein